MKFIKRTFGLCKHEHVRCIHGDEIWSTMRGFRKFSFARSRCLDCNKALYNGPLPKVCTVTGEPHRGTISY